MRNPLNNKVQVMKPSGIRKFFDIVSEMKDAISLGVGEPDFETPWHIREEAIYSLEKGRTVYTSNAGLKELKVEVCNYLKRRYNLEYPDKNVLVTIGGSEAIDAALKHAGVSRENAVMFGAPSLDEDNGKVHYDVEFGYNGFEYDYEVSVADGKITNIKYSYAFDAQLALKAVVTINGSGKATNKMTYTIG